MSEEQRCPACSSQALELFHRERGVPAHSCLLLDSRDEAVGFPRGDIDLAVCHDCGFITNLVFDPALEQYSSQYEETQGFSPRFRQFAEELAERWVTTHHLRGRTALEIGCGKGEFLVGMCRAGLGQGIGIDPSVIPERVPDSEAAQRARWVPALFDETRLDLVGEVDAVVCRHTLEHIHPVADFMRLVRRGLGEREAVPVLFELPDVLRVLREVAFWDVYYEHCSYFSPGSLARLFRREGFNVRDVSLAYEDQYLLLEAHPSATAPEAPPLEIEESPADVVRDAQAFAAGYAEQVERWRQLLGGRIADGGRVVLWGAGSKAVAYLNALGMPELQHAVDINPHKHGKFIAGSGQEIVAPEALLELRPTTVVAMNAVYRDEIAGMLASLGVEAELLAV